MCKHHATVNIAYGIYAGHIGSHVVVDGYASAFVIFHSGVFEPYAAHIGSATCSHEHHIGFDAFVLAFALISNLTIGYAAHCGLHHKVDAALLELLASALCHVGVDRWQAFL